VQVYRPRHKRFKRGKVLPEGQHENANKRSMLVVVALKYHLSIDNGGCKMKWSNGSLNYSGFANFGHVSFANRAANLSDLRFRRHAGGLRSHVEDQFERVIHDSIRTT
jgi:hypothetical protein